MVSIKIPVLIANAKLGKQTYYFQNSSLPLALAHEPLKHMKTQINCFRFNMTFSSYIGLVFFFPNRSNRAEYIVHAIPKQMSVT